MFSKMINSGLQPLLGIGGQFLCFKLDSNRDVIKDSHSVKEAAPSYCPSFNTIGIDTSPDNSRLGFKISLIAINGH